MTIFTNIKLWLGIGIVAFLIYYLYTQNKFLKVEVENQKQANLLIIEGYETSLKVQKETLSIEIKNETLKQVLDTNSKKLNQNIKEHNEKIKSSNIDDNFTIVSF